MAGGPRKFSEKIALLNQKEAEGNAAFDSIMVEVKAIRPNTSGSQLDMLESLTENSLKSNVNHSNIDEAIAFNEHVSVTYDNQTMSNNSNRQKMSNSNHYGGQHHKHKKQSDEHRHSLSKTEHTQVVNTFQQQMHQQQNQTNSSFLQLPNQSDSFRRAHSDSSINQSVAASNNFMANNNNHQPVNYTPQHNQQYNNHMQNIQFQQQFQQAPPPQFAHTHTQPSSPIYPYNFQTFSTDFSPQIAYKNLTLPLANTTSSTSTNNSTNSSINNNNNNTSTSNSSPTMNNNCSSNSTNSSNVPSLPNQLPINQSSNLSLNQPSSPTNLSPTMNIQPQMGKFISKNDPQHSANNLTRNLSPIYNLQPNQQLPSPTSQSSSTSPTQFPYQTNFNSPQHLHQQYQATFQQQQTSTPTSPIKPDQLLSPNQQNNNLLSPNNIVNTAGGSLPDLTAFQFQANQSHQTIQIQEYNQRLSHTNNHQYDLQLLQPNFAQHNHIGAVKPTHTGSVSPTRGMSRYSPTHSNTNLTSLANRRPSPQRNLTNINNNNNNANTNTSTQSTPSSPLHPSMQQSGLPLEFTINSQQITNYLSNTNGPSVYRTNGANGTTPTGESLPPSPQSQQSCFNSPQGSPGPLSISPQDINPFTSPPPNSYDIMQRKFDSINLDSNGNPYMLHTNGILGKPMVISMESSNNGDSSLSEDGGANSTNSNTNTNNHSIMNSSRSGSLSSNSSGNNLILNNSNNNNNTGNIYEDLQSLNASYSNSTTNKSVLNKNHKNSIPNIILTFSGDSIEEKNDIIIKDLSNDLNYDEDLLIKNEQFDLDLQILSEPVTIDDQNTINYTEHTLYQSS